MKRVLPLVAIMLASAPSLANAQSTSHEITTAAWLNLGIGGTTDHHDDGFAVTSGLSIQFGPVFATFTPLDLALSRGNSSPYFRDSDNVCRDGRGRYATDASCRAVDVAYAFTGDVALEVPKTGILIGVGARHNGIQNPFYALAGFQRHLKETDAVMWSIRFQVGRDYLSGIAALHVSLGRSRP